ncbi:hypothetical protein EYC84_000286 [Monilinia fructicola]|uniref:Uncharacterized protein n=1 Tax=Monilinia fructicola TaxID=38448 RepID=A0A5M9JNR0_MONFR|nr:hypothetical protein EYC84_000286 [Monilinia fructicola]
MESDTNTPLLSISGGFLYSQCNIGRREACRLAFSWVFICRTGFGLLGVDWEMHKSAPLMYMWKQIQGYIRREEHSTEPQQ